MRFIQFKVYLSICLSLYMCVSLFYLLFWFYGFCQYDRKDEQTNEWTNRQTDIPNTVYKSLRERVV
jgi:hypothetical protein